MDTRLYVSTENIQAAFDEFMTGEGTRNPKREKKVKKVKKPAKASSVTGLENARRLGEDMAVLATPRLQKQKLPFYFPEYRTNGSTYANDTPRVYSLRDEKGKLHRAYRIVIYNGAPGEYYGVQGQTWRDPPLLDSPDRIREINGRKLELYLRRHETAPGGVADAARRLLGDQHAQPQDHERADARHRGLAAASGLQVARLRPPRRVTTP